jgi:hypothetical protein
VYVEFLAFALVAPARIIRWEMEATSILTRGGAVSQANGYFNQPAKV